jgi:ArsR family transcriptional regulator
LTTPGRRRHHSNISWNDEMSRSATCTSIDHVEISGAAMPDAAAMAAASAMFRALGDPQRLELLVRLAAGETCVTALASAEGEKISTVSARLKALHTVQLVRSRREARHVFYSVADDHVLTLVENALDHAAENKTR